MAERTSDAIVIGSGVAGLSTALRLALRGLTVQVMDRGRLAGGSTSKASGLLGQLRGTPEATRFLMRSVELLAEVQERAGLSIYSQTGGLRVARSAARVAELESHMAIAKASGLAMERVSREEAAERLPGLRTDDLSLIAFCPTDGYLEPPMLAKAYIKSCRDLGITFWTECPVEAIHTAKGKVSGVQARSHAFEAPIVVNAGGPWSYLVGRLAGAALPTAPIGHYYFSAAPCAGLEMGPETATLRDRENRIYTRPKNGGLRVGIYETNPVPYDMEELGDGFRMEQLTAAREHPNVDGLFAAAERAFPAVRNVKEVEITTGIMTFTPDTYPLCGGYPDLEGLYHCTGFCGHGIVQSPAIGLLMSQLILDGKTEFDLGAIQADRFFELDELREREVVKARCYETYASYYGKG